ncbi:glycoside hydrolase family 2 protein [Candidatus Xianfuyuplasma coldseepsis]|uniref:Glycoside hydrolase family 2 protein n=1 Tax=Candidatus Xianfuyuplasma coldseepsis TaxID=2782163 RepID=A0A7L7KS92_9MOLU|nr:glycoside hydrolase family 2 TIM barrel-domain containing protein [Xianfuyuplasma coldseepsis]QMS85076.1 glycoside hydrolase family 2 protein [Xianfuyuplasma coldseepsis]
MKKIRLNGEWSFTKDNGFDANAKWEIVQVPHTWNNLDGQDGGNDYYRGTCFYKRDIEVASHEGRVFLEFEGVNSIGTVYLNGTELGTHKGGYSTFRFDITDSAIEGTNELLVAVDNSHHEDVMPLMADFTFYGGIYRDSYLVYTAPIAFDLTHKGAPGVYVSQTDISYKQANFTIDTYMNNDLEDTDVSLSIQVLDANDSVVLSQEEVIHLSNHVHTSSRLQLNNPHLWNGVKDPYLYTIVVTLIANNTIVDERRIPTGFRFFHMDENAFYLNGELLRLNGVSRHQDRKDVGNALTKAMHEEDMAFIKEIGANSIRLAHYQQAQYFYDLCDTEGMIIWAEIPYITRPSKEDHTGSNPMSQMEELVKQNYNHSSIVMWGVQNEITAVGKRDNVEEIVTNLHNLTKSLDPYRLTTQAQVSMHPALDSMNTITDVVAFNHYFGWYSGVVEDFKGWLADYREKNPTRPLGLSEYGVEGIIKYHSDTPQVKDYTEEYHALWHEKAYDILSNTPYIWGTYVWNMFTFAADFRDEGGVQGLNNKGLVNFDRTIRKDAFFYYKAKWSKEPMVHLNSKRFVERHNKDITLKAYSNLDEITFFLNGQKVPTTDHYDVIYTANVTLQEGENTVTVCAGELCDETVFITVDEPNPSYSVPEADQGKGVLNLNVDNWFDDQLDNDEILQIDPMYYNVNMTIQELLDNPDTEQIFDTYFSEFRKHPMFEMAAGMSLMMIHEFDKNSMPLALLIQVNKALQQYKK